MLPSQKTPPSLPHPLKVARKLLRQRPEREAKRRLLLRVVRSLQARAKLPSRALPPLQEMLAVKRMAARRRPTLARVARLLKLRRQRRQRESSLQA